MTISKVLEKIVYICLYKYLEKNNTLFDSQYGFKTKRSCEHAISKLISKLLHSKEDGKKVVLFLDLSKTFDTLNHSILLQKLDLYGICGKQLNWFESYLQERRLSVKVNTLSNKNEYSDTYGITYGAAQGSCLGPLLFIIFCNDIYLLPLIGSLIIFADDTMLINSSRHKVYLEYSMRHDLKLLDNWFRAIQLSLNLSKTVLMNFWQNGNNVNLDLDDIPIPTATTTKFLGVYLDNQLNWKLHTTMLFNKIQSNKYLLSISKNLLNEQSLRSMYFAHIYSHLNYSLVTWGSMISNLDKEKLYKVQKSCIRILGCKRKRKNINNIFMDLQILPFPEMIKLELCKYGYKIFFKCYLIL